MSGGGACGCMSGAGGWGCECGTYPLVEDDANVVAVAGGVKDDDDEEDDDDDRVDGDGDAEDDVGCEYCRCGVDDNDTGDGDTERDRAGDVEGE